MNQPHRAYEFLRQKLRLSKRRNTFHGIEIDDENNEYRNKREEIRQKYRDNNGGKEAPPAIRWAGEKKHPSNNNNKINRLVKKHGREFLQQVKFKRIISRPSNNVLESYANNNEEDRDVRGSRAQARNLL